MADALLLFGCHRCVRMHRYSDACLSVALACSQLHLDSVRWSARNGSATSALQPTLKSPLTCAKRTSRAPLGSFTSWHSNSADASSRQSDPYGASHWHDIVSKARNRRTWGDQRTAILMRAQETLRSDACPPHLAAAALQDADTAPGCAAHSLTSSQVGNEVRQPLIVRDDTPHLESRLRLMSAWETDSQTV